MTIALSVSSPISKLISLPLARILILCLALASAALDPALADNAKPDGARNAAIAAQAAKELRDYLTDIAKKGERPDLAKPEVAGMLNRIYDLAAFTALPPTQSGDLPWLIEWMEAANGTNKAILMYGGKPGPQPDLDAITRNMTDYADQVARAANFLIRGQCREATSMRLFMAALPPEQRTPLREQSLAGFSNSMALTLINEIGAVIINGKPANAHLASSALRETSADWASFFPPAQRTQLLSQLPGMTAQVKDETSRADLAAFTSAIAAVK